MFNIRDHKKCVPNKCDSGICITVNVCPTIAIEQEASFEHPYIVSGCYACNKCVENCPLDAIILV